MPYVYYGKPTTPVAPRFDSALLGSWDIDADWFDHRGGCRTARGEWHFAWILGGRGVQDVLFPAGSPPDHFGTTLRCYDPAADVWHVGRMQPYGGEFVHLIGHKVGDRIVQESIYSNAAHLERWSFLDITATTFLWQGELLTDSGATWFLEQEMHAIRRKG